MYRRLQAVFEQQNGKVIKIEDISQSLHAMTNELNHVMDKIGNEF